MVLGTRNVKMSFQSQHCACHLNIAHVQYNSLNDPKYAGTNGIVSKVSFLVDPKFENEDHRERTKTVL